ncbi:LytR/AlgR family response regulator transcription factor [Chitinimonas koreensis]|uniref:LytR/AlgR family response regulator transcription factor n=1 Tax=Chitinimonas koreensis TaxID=356302 RepID=UPI000416B3E5|nr:LytTR family DNA-binding domain-containing protein [Chitinimonas koreensis]QNM98760.1 response regulator transcription factor [Chitinimonas koreensis]
MPTAILVEDQQLIRYTLKNSLKLLWPELEIVAESDDGIEALGRIQALRPDYVFLDINLPGLTGMEVAKLVSGTVNIIFLTALDHYAIKAFELGATDYIVKPLTLERLKTAVDRIRSRAAQATAAMPEAVLEKIAQLGRQTSYLRWIQASAGSQIQLIPVEEVCYFQAEAKYTKVASVGAESLIRKTIKELSLELDPNDFMQIHRSTIVNLRHIDAVVRKDSHVNVRLRNRNEVLSVSQTFQHLFKHM